MERYWGEEPWGPYRDNLHAAIIAMQIIKAAYPKAKPKFDDFMLKFVVKKVQGNGLSGLASMLKTMATPRAAGKKRKG